MANTLQYREHRGMAGVIEVVECEWDFAKGDVGTAAAYNMLKIKESTVLVDSMTKVLTTFTADGSATLIIGRTGDTDAILASTAVASLTSTTGVFAGDAASRQKLLVTDDYILMTIGTANMTAGRMKVVLFLQKFA